MRDYNSNSKDFEKLGSSGHFLEGSSAALGLIKVRTDCARIHQYSNEETSSGGDGKYLKHSHERLSGALEVLKADYIEARARLGTLLWYLTQRDARPTLNH